MNLSFILIAYNEERTIGAALESVFTQTGLPARFEVIVVNDGSTDGTLAVVRDYQASHPQLKCITLPANRGRGFARARGVKAAKGMYLAFIDSDIILPTDWFIRCKKYMSQYDACAGTAVPDGDVTWIYNTFKLRPKVARHATVITGSNGLYKRQVFNHVMFQEAKKDGEDVDLNYQMAAAKLKVSRADGVVVEHHETKGYLHSLQWLYVTGRGAARQWYEHRTIRLPDISFLGLCALVMAGVLAAVITLSWIAAVAATALIFVFITLTSGFHLRGKFYLARNPLAAAAAVLANDTLLLAYFAGRFVGVWKQRGIQP